MYCVKCGVRLADGTAACPLCRTPVRDPDGAEAAPAAPTYPERYPAPPKTRRYPILAFLTALLVAVSLSAFIYCITTLHKVGWSGYVMLACALVYFAVLFPFWFERREPLIFLPIGFGLACGYLLYICLYTGGSWFLSFAFPVTMLAGLLTTASVLLFRFGKRRRLLKIGILLTVIGLSNMLIEFFLCITFDTRMFAWSLYPVCSFSLVGLVLILCGTIPGWRAYLEKKLFL